MKPAKYLICFLVLVATLSGCQKKADEKKEKFIADMLTAFNKQKKSLLQQAKGVFADIRIYRDGKTDIVVMERKLTEGYGFDAGLDMKSELVKQMKNSEESTKALELGIKVRLIDKDSNEKVLSDVTISSKDL